MGRFVLAIGVTCLALSSQSCVRATWARVNVNRPLTEEMQSRMEPAFSDLDQCLAELGAPLFVWEVSDEEVGLAYGWDHHLEWGVNVSVPLSQELSASLDYEDHNKNLHGLVLIFDGNDRLLRRQNGYLRDLIEENRRRRPSFIETPNAPAPQE